MLGMEFMDIYSQVYKIPHVFKFFEAIIVGLRDAAVTVFIIRDTAGNIFGTLSSIKRTFVPILCFNETYQPKFSSSALSVR